LIIVDTEKEWEYNRGSNQSKSYNSPFIGDKLTGKVLYTFNNKQLFKSV